MTFPFPYIPSSNSLYKIERSLRFNAADSAYLNRTFTTATDRKKLYCSFWIKRALLGSQQIIFSSYNGDGSNFTQLYFDSSDKLNFSGDSGGTNTFGVITAGVYRDVTAWMHIEAFFDSTNGTAGDRVQIWINGIRQTTSGTNPSSNAILHMQSAVAVRIGSTVAGGNYLGACLAELILTDGQSMTLPVTGKTEAGVWVPVKFTGTYGINGFYLDFSDNSNTTSSTLGADRSGNGNDWTPNNFSVSAGVGNDSLVDSPTNYGSDTGAGGEVRGNYWTLNPLHPSGGTRTFSNTNLTVTGAGVSNNSTERFFDTPDSGVWFVEAELGAVGTNSITAIHCGGYIYYASGTGGISGLPASYTTGDKVGIVANINAGEVKFYKLVTGAWVQQGNTQSITPGVSVGWGVVLGGASTAPIWHVNFGQRPFSATAPTGAKALCTQNLSTPIIKKSRQHFDIVLDTGTNIKTSAEAVFSGSDFMEWIKDRANTNNHQLIDTVRGTSAVIQSNTANDETTYSIPSGNSVGWVWKKGPLFDIVTYTGNGSNRTISHNLGSVPKFIITKARTTASTDKAAAVYHISNTSAPETDYLVLNTTAATVDDNTLWNDTAPTSSVFSVGTNAFVNQNGDTYVAYLFAEIPGLSKFGSYTGNGNADGPFVYCGFKPRWIMVKRTDTAGYSWCLMDTARSPYNPSFASLYPNISNAEDSVSWSLDFLSSGFKLRHALAHVNASGGTYIFAAFAETPFKYARTQ